MLAMCRLFVLLALLCVAGLAQSKSAPGSVIPGKYHCVFFINGALQTTPGFTIQGDGSYKHDSGSQGRYAYDASKALVTFQGGGLDGQAGLVEIKGKTGYVRLYNERRSRTVVDCDTPVR